MSKPSPIAVLRERLQEHEAVKAWSQLESEHLELDSIEILKHKKQSSVYRLKVVRQGGAAMIAKRCRAATAHVERVIYEELLPRMSMPALRCYGFLKEPEGKFCWLFLQDAAGERYSPQLAQHRAAAARWLGKAHLAAVPPELKARLPVRELGYHLELLRRCRTILLDHLSRNRALSDDGTAVFGKVVSHFEAIESHWSLVDEICAVMPRTLVHGDFVIKNVRVRDAATDPTLLVFDWELAGWGVPVTDLAQFVGGVACPDLSVYCSVLNREHPRLDLREIHRVAICGNLLRLVDEIDWALSGLEFDSLRFLLKPIATLRRYEVGLTEGLHALKVELS